MVRSGLVRFGKVGSGEVWYGKVLFSTPARINITQFPRAFIQLDCSSI